MKEIRVKTRNSIYVLNEDEHGLRRVVQILTDNFRDIHQFILDNPDLQSGVEVGHVMFGYGWHSSTVLEILP